MIKFSIIVPNYNHAAFLNERIDSILAQVYPHIELIILDDGSTDKSREIIESYRGQQKISHIVYNNKNSGSPFHQWSKGIALTTNEWIWIAESDDIANTKFLETMASFIQDHPSAGLVYCNSHIIDINNITPGVETTAAITNADFSTTQWDHSHVDSPKTAIDTYLKKKNIILNISSAVIKKAFVKVPLPKIKKMKYYGDWYAYIAIASITPIGYCHQPLNTFRRHPESLIQVANKRGQKTDCFRILGLLLRQSCISGKKELIDDFVGRYLNVGLRTEGLLFSVGMISRYFMINPLLALQVTRRIIGSKFRHKK